MTAAAPKNGSKTVLMIAANPAVSPVTGWPVGFWWAELTHPYWAFAEAGYTVEIASPGGRRPRGRRLFRPRGRERVFGA
jgi:putative intracellular protease/amidase